MKKIRIERINGELAAIIPSETAEALHVSEGDELYLNVDQRGIRLTPWDPEVDDPLEAYAEAKKLYSKTLRALAE